MAIYKIPEKVSRITETLKNKVFLAYLVGGCVRDLIIGRPPKDWDVATSATPEEIIPLFEKTVYENMFGTVAIIDEEEEGSLRAIEVTPFRLEGKYSDKRHPDSVTFSKKLEDDLGRRDFTMNALALDPSAGNIVDLFDGQKDIDKKLIRAVGRAEDRFEEDPLRMLRAVRFAAELGFTISDETAKAITEKSTLLKHISIERIRDEFEKMIMSENPMIGLVISQKMALLKEFLPELAEAEGVKQNGEHKYDVFEHTLRAVQHAADKGLPFHVRLAALFHDIGKPRTREWNKEKNDYTFYGHEVIGMRMTKKIMERMRFPVKTIDTVVTLVRNHMFFTDTEKITLSAVRRIITRVGRENIWDLINLRTCDRIGMGRPKEEPYRLRKYESMIEEALRDPTSVGMLAIDGKELMEVTKLPPGPKIGHILHALLEAVLDDPTLNTKEKMAEMGLKMAVMSDVELEKLGKSGRSKKEEAEEEALADIRSKYHVK